MDQLKYAQHELLCNELRIMELKGNKIYPNQEHIAQKVSDTFATGEVVATMVVARTQSGKTGSMCAVIRELTNPLFPNPSNLDNVFVITGLSSIEWKTQTIERMPSAIKHNVIHANDLHVIADKIESKRDVLIIMDEVHIAALKTQRVHQLFNTAKLNDPIYMQHHNIRIVQYSATPNKTIFDLQVWGGRSNIHIADPGDNYVGPLQLIQQNRIRQVSGELGKSEQANQEFIQAVGSFNSPRYHFVRINVRQSTITYKQELYELFKSTEINVQIVSYQGSNSDITDINKVLMQQPTIHTIILLKNMLRCAKTIHKIHIGVLYDRPVINTCDDVIIQGLTGRNTGYDTNNDSICFTELKSIYRYETLWDEIKNNNISIQTTSWKTNNITKDTFNIIDNDTDNDNDIIV